MVSSMTISIVFLQTLVFWVFFKEDSIVDPEKEASRDSSLKGIQTFFNGLPDLSFVFLKRNFFDFKIYVFGSLKVWFFFFWSV